MRRFLLVSIVPLLVACSGPTPSAPAPAVGAPSSAVTAPKAESQSASAKPEPKVASQATSQAPAKAETKPATDVRPQAAATAAPKASIAPPSENHGIALGQPVKIGSNLVAVLVTNTTDQVMTFTVKVQYRKGSDVVDVTGTVTDLLPKQTRATTANVYSVIPAGPESVSVAVTDVPVRVIDVSSGTSGQAGPPKATVNFKETGIKLKVTPHVTNNRQVLMKVVAERSDLRTLAAADLGFTIRKQNAENQLLVADGETAVIGGLTVTEVNQIKSGIPLLVDLPIVGKLFGFSSNEEHRRDLIILITPRIIDEGQS